MILGKKIIGANPFEHYLINKKLKNKKKKSFATSSLTLTSMVDMFSMLVVFLLQTFSSTPEILVNKGIQLPDSLTGGVVISAPVLSLNKNNEVFLDQKLVGNLQQIMIKPNLLGDKINNLKFQWMTKHPSEAFPGKLNFQADREVKSDMISRLVNIVTSSEIQSIEMSIISQ